MPSFNHRWVFVRKLECLYQDESPQKCAYFLSWYVSTQSMTQVCGAWKPNSFTYPFFNARCKFVVTHIIQYCLQSFCTKLLAMSLAE